MLDLDLSNLCNLKCVMCDSDRSSQHAKDKGLGVSAISREYIESLIEISNDLRLVTIQGGEPSIMEEFAYYFGELHKKGTIEAIAEEQNEEIPESSPASSILPEAASASFMV